MNAILATILSSIPILAERPVFGSSPFWTAFAYIIACLVGWLLVWRDRRRARRNPPPSPGIPSAPSAHSVRIPFDPSSRHRSAASRTSPRHWLAALRTSLAHAMRYLLANPILLAAIILSLAIVATAIILRPPRYIPLNNGRGSGAIIDRRIGEAYSVSRKLKESTSRRP